MEKSTAFVGLDVHKESIEVGIAHGGEVRHFGRCGGDAAAVDQLVRKLSQRHRRLEFVYEAGPCGFWIYRRLKSRGVGCMVVSPSMMPRRPGDHIKTDRRDCLNLAASRARASSRRSTCPMLATKRCATWCAPVKIACACNARRGSGCRRCCCATTSATRARPRGRRLTDAGSRASSCPILRSRSPSRNTCRASRRPRGASSAWAA